MLQNVEKKNIRVKYRYAPGRARKMHALERFYRMNGGIHVQVPNAYETREDLVSHSAVPRTYVQPPYQYHRKEILHRL